ncbi:MAG: hypothetical protein Ta2B_20130 [Termitinemataceae bacterium]|nr:MAG: hypothetical protein Ta2B_20130 [Termitinemataceae bacterium]
MNDTYLTAIIAGLVPAVAYVVTTMITTRRNSEDIRDMKSEMKDMRMEIKSQDEKFTTMINTLDNKFSASINALDDKFSASINALDNKFSASINALNNRFSAIENDVAVIKALCQERSDRIHKRNS